MSWIGWRTRPDIIESTGLHCPDCDRERSFSRVNEQRAFFVATLPLSRWMETGNNYFQCEMCGKKLMGDRVSHESQAISQIESRAPLAHDSDEDLNLTVSCPNCGRENSVATRICPRCEKSIPE